MKLAQNYPTVWIGLQVYKQKALKLTVITNIGLNNSSKYIKSYLNSKGKKKVDRIYALTGFL